MEEDRPPRECCVRVKWWGEPQDGMLLWPQPAERSTPFSSGRRGATTAAYAITCGPQQLAKYLGDMRTLVLDVLLLTGAALTVQEEEAELARSWLR